MLLSKTLLCLLLIALSAVDASPLSRHSGKGALRFATKVNERGILNIVEKDRARVQAIKQVGQLGKRTASLRVTNDVVNFVAFIGVGTPPTRYPMLVDTATADTFVGTGKTYVPTSSSKNTGNTVSVTFGSGGWTGEEWIDTVTLSPELVITNQSIGVANTSTGFNGVYGVLGIGPVNLTSGTVENTDLVPTVLGNLYAQKTISEEVLGMYFIPASEPHIGGTGELTFGGYDSSVIRGSVNYVPLTTSSPASSYWAFEQSITYGGETILSTTSGIVDAGTALILLATDAFQKYQNLTGATIDKANGMLSITSDQYAKLQTLTFNIGGNSYDLTPNGQIWPRSLNTNIGGNETAIYLVVSDSGRQSGSGMDFANGYTFLERYYSIYDTTNGRIGFASTAYTESTAN